MKPTTFWPAVLRLLLLLVASLATTCPSLLASSTRARADTALRGVYRDVLVTSALLRRGAPEDYECCMYRAAQASADLALIKLHFGVSPDKLPAWQDIERVALAALFRLQSAREQTFGLVRDSACICYCLFLDLGGERAAALEVLSSPFGPDAECGNWGAAVSASVALCAASIELRNGNEPRARSSVHMARSVQVGLLRPVAAQSLDAIDAYLLFRSGAASTAANLAQRLVDLYPGTLEADFAGNLLRKRALLRQPTLAILETYQRDFRRPRDARATIASAIARHGFPGSFDLLLRWLQRDPFGSGAYVDALGCTGDRRAVPVLVRIMQREVPGVRLAAALALLQLGELARVHDYFAIVDEGGWGTSQVDGYVAGTLLPEEQDEHLRGAFHGGPELPYAVLHDEPAMRSAWITWAQAHPPKSAPVADPED